MQVKTVAVALEIHPFMLSKWRKDARDGRLRGRASKAPRPGPTREIAQLQALEKAHALLLAGWAAATGEGVHAAVHVGLLFGAYLVWRLAPWARRQDLPRAQQADERFEYLQQSVDAIALEVERIGEKQRFSGKLRVEQGETPEGGRQIAAYRRFVGRFNRSRILVLSAVMVLGGIALALIGRERLSHSAGPSAA